MAGEFDPKSVGFAGWSDRMPNAFNGESSQSIPKLSGSATFKPGFLMKWAAGGTVSRVAVQGTNEVQTITFGGTTTGGTFTITFGAATTSAIAWNATAADVQNALQSLSTIGLGNITVTGGPGPAVLTLTFGGDLSATNVAAVTTTSSLTGTSPTLTVATATAGVLGKVTDTTGFAGFCGNWEVGPTSNWGRQFAQAPLNLESHTNPASSPNALVIPARNRIYQGRIEPNVAVTQAMLNTTVSCGWNVDKEQFFVLSGDTSTPLLTIVGVPADQIGVLGGMVDFIVVATAL